MRAEEPVSRDDAYGTWHVFRYADVEPVLADPQTFSSDLTGLIPRQPEVELFSRGNFVRMDPPRHDKLRRLVSKAFTPKVVAALAPRIGELAGELLDEVRGQDRFDVVASLAYPLPVIVIAELIGVPPGDRPRFRQWADALLRNVPADRLVPDEATLKAMGDRMRDMIDYLGAHIRDRRAHPTGDLTSTLIDAEVDGERLVDGEIVGFVGLLLLAGHITTTTLISNAVVCLDAHPDAARALRADPTLVPSALEEVLRYRTPFPRLARIATAPATIGDRQIAARDVITLWLASANHDDERFADPERFDITRAPNPHLSFGHGIHFCLGAPLARLEGAIAMPLLLDRCKDLAVAEGAEFYDARVMTGAISLPVDAVWA
jgi:cytochrome P450